MHISEHTTDLTEAAARHLHDQLTKHITAAAIARTKAKESHVHRQVRLVMQKQCTEIGTAIRAALPAGVGFVLVTFDFGADGNQAYVSSGQPAGTILMLEELLHTMRHEKRRR